eukprot:1159727-Pelagomonas_calceolata.AAC.4
MILPSSLSTLFAHRLHSPDGHTPAPRAKPSTGSARAKGSGGVGGGGSSVGSKRKKGAKAGGAEGVAAGGEDEDGDGGAQPKSERKTPARKPPAPPEIDVSDAAPYTFATLIPECNIAVPELVRACCSCAFAKKYVLMYLESFGPQP